MNKQPKKLDLTRETLVARLEEKLVRLEEAHGGVCRTSYTISTGTYLSGNC